MKKYIIKLYVDEIKCDDFENDNCSLSKCLACQGCTALVITNLYGGEVVNTLVSFDVDKKSVKVFHYLLETFDEVDDKHFMTYLFKNDSDFRITDLEDDRIMVDFNSNLDLFKDLIDMYGYESINLYNRNYDDKTLKRNIMKLKCIRNAYYFLSTSFGVGISVSLFQVFNGNAIFALIAGYLSYKGYIDTWDEFQQKYIDVEVNKRLLKKNNK